MSTNTSKSQPRSSKVGLLLFGLLTLTALILFGKSFKPELVLFSSDGPLGITSSECVASPKTFTGAWWDVFWLGTNAGTAAPSLNFLVFFSFGPLLFAKFHAIIAVLILGWSAYFFCRQLQFSQPVAGLCAIAAGLNMNYFSNICWGLPTRAFTLAFIFVALGLLVGQSTRFRWIRLVLAGCAVGMAVTEGADNGAIFSLYVAAFAMFFSLIRDGSLPLKIGRGGATVAIIAVCAGLVATQSLISLAGTAIKGVAYLEKEKEDSEQVWNMATQWSLPKTEILRVIVPGLFGYRTETDYPTPKGGEYWGRVGQQPGWETHKQGSPRHSGSGEYAGVLVILVAAWALAHSFRRNGAYTDVERKIIWFWSVAAIVSVLLAFGRHAPFYRVVYSLPYFSTIRNPIKFMHPFHLCALILFGFGLQGLARLYLDRAATTTRSMGEQLKAWWGKANSFEKKWTIGTLGAVGAALIAVLIYSSARRNLVEFLSNNAFQPEEAANIARFSVGEVSAALFFLVLAVALVALIMSGFFAGPRARWATVLLGLLLVVDLGRADRRWIKYFDYKERYAANALTDTLRNKAYEHRVTVASPQLQSIYRAEWLQHQFPYYNIQALDMAQDPRMAADKQTYLQGVTSNIMRYWQLTNTRYLIGGAGGFVDQMNQQLDPIKRRFRQVLAFVPAQSPGGEYIHLQGNPAGPFALIEFTGALPRARLYSQWQVSTNDQETLRQLTNEQFNVEQTVILADNAPPSPTGDGSASPGTVEYVSYSPKHIKLRANAATPSVLLLNDKYDPAWKVWVDGKEEKLLRANFIVRAVHLQPGNHEVEFKFKPSLTGLFVTLSAMSIGLVLCGFLVVTNRREPAPEPHQEPRPSPESVKPAGRSK